MKPVTFSGQNTCVAEDQPEYQTLPAYHDSSEGTITSCWALSWRERLSVLASGRVWVTSLTFNRPLQPLKVGAKFKDVQS